MTSKLVQSFNALPRHSKTPSGLVPNEWHFDIRYVHLEKTPSHILAIMQPESRYFHMERLPIGLSTESSGIAFFPESAKEAAPQVAKAILYAFVQRLGQKQMMTFSGSMTSTDQLAPWRLTTEDKALATAVGAEFKRLGVCPDALCRIGVSTTSMNKIMQDKFHNLFRGLMKMVGIKDHISPFISTPMSIVFQKLHPRAHPKPSEGEDGKLELALNYAQELCRSRPLKSNEEVGAASLGIVEEIKAVQKMITERPVNLVKAEADAGDPESAFDYGLRCVTFQSSLHLFHVSFYVRLLVGLGCEYDRTLARAYIIKALSSTRASDELKCAAHGTLINWYMSADEKTLPTRYLFTASHHANIAASLCRRVSPPGAPASPAVLWFMSRVFEPHSHNVPELMYFFKDAWRAWEDRTAQMAAGREKMEEKRLKYPNRYRCAAVGCGIEADTGKMLQKCKFFRNFIQWQNIT